MSSQRDEGFLYNSLTQENDAHLAALPAVMGSPEGTSHDLRLANSSPESHIPQRLPNLHLKSEVIAHLLVVSGDEVRQLARCLPGCWDAAYLGYLCAADWTEEGGWIDGGLPIWVEGCVL